MKVFHKLGVALVAIASLTAADHAMAACSKSKTVAWWSGGQQHHWHSCWSNGTRITLAYFYLNSTTTQGNHGTVNLYGGTVAQINGLTQSGGWVTGCNADDFTGGGNTPVYLNWNGSYKPSCSQAFLARMYAESFY